VALVLLAGAAQAVRADEVIDRVLAVAAGDVITQSDVEAARDLGLETGPDILSRLIDRSLMLAEVDRYAPPEPSAEAVDHEVQLVQARFASGQAFDAALARVGLDTKYLREILRQNLRIRAYISERFAVAEDQQRALVDEWVAGLRRRATITELDLTGR
jgi:hypothetical protein